MNSLVGYILSCKCCDKTFVICKQCYRGHKYCSDSCRDVGYEEARVKARKKYNSSLEARLDHRDRNRKYRLNSHEKTVMDKTSTEQESTVNMHSHKSNHQKLLEVSKHDGICISCLREIFKQGVHLYERSQ
jgi:hypothetical protein